MTQPELEQIARQIAKYEGVDPALVCAVCHHESGNWQRWAFRYEPGFYRRYIEKMTGLSDTEKTGRATSWGLMQVMGQTAREFGFSETYLTALLDPAVGILFGCKKLKRCLDDANGNIRDALLKYNGGANLAYPDAVLHHYQKYVSNLS